MLKKLTVGWVAVILGTLSFANAEPAICTEVEAWISDATADPPFSSLDSRLKSENIGSFAPGSALETVGNNPCIVATNQQARMAGDTYWTEIKCSLPIDGSEMGDFSKSNDALNALQQQFFQCSALSQWEARGGNHELGLLVAWSRETDMHEFMLYALAQKVDAGDTTTQNYNLSLALRSRKSAPQSDATIGSSSQSQPSASPDRNDGAVSVSETASETTQSTTSVSTPAPAVEPDICTELEWWIIAGQTETPLSSLAPTLASGEEGEYSPGSTLQTSGDQPCTIVSGEWQRGQQFGQIDCKLPISYSGQGAAEDARALRASLTERVSQCRALRSWEMREFGVGEEFSSNWRFSNETHTFSLAVSTEKRTSSSMFGTSVSYEVPLRFRARQRPEPAVTEADPPLPSQTARPRDQNRWATRVAGDYPEIAERLGWEGIVGLTVIVDDNGRAKSCHVTRSSGWPILDHTACESMKTHARFYAAEDDQGNPVESKFSTRIAYQFR